MTTLQTRILDAVADPDEIHHRELNHQLLLHAQVVEAAQDHPNIRNRLSIVLQQLAAHGRTPIVKGCTGDNRHWRRSPIGGNNGMQFYLWWTQRHLQDHPAICIRAARHHDDHSPLFVGDIDRDYLPLTQPDFVGDDHSIAATPWTPDQQEFVDSTNPCRIIHGSPGSGKTTALWRAIETRANQRVLYVSWSRALASQARERFLSFAPENVDVHATDFISFLSEMAGYDVPRLTLSVKQATCQQAIAAAHIPPRTLGPWNAYPHSLFAEFRSIIAGRAIPHAPGVLDHPIDKLHTLSYLGLEEYSKHRPELDPAEIRAAHETFRLTLSNASAMLQQSMPELTAAHRAITWLRNTRDKPPYHDSDRIVIDEAQDLTLAEFHIFIELMLAIRRTTGRNPLLLIAGDEGQTILPTAFRWSHVANTLRQHGATPVQHHLSTVLRSPRRIAETIHNSSSLYTSVLRHHRPSDQHDPQPSDTIEAQTITCSVADPESLHRLIDRLAAIPDTAVISPDPSVPDHFPDHTAANVVNTATAKGLEYRHVCIVQPGRAISNIADQAGTQSALVHLNQRQAIDRLRVAISRATETLVFIDTDEHPQDVVHSRSILAHSAHYQPEELVRYLVSSDRSPDEIIVSLLQSSQASMDSDPAQSWASAQRALALLGNHDSPTAVHDDSLRNSTVSTATAAALRCIAETQPTAEQRQLIAHTMVSHLRYAYPQEVIQAFNSAALWLSDISQSPFDMLQSVSTAASAPPPIAAAIAPYRVTIFAAIRACSEDPSLAQILTRPIETWLEAVFPNAGYDNLVNASRVTAIELLLFHCAEPPTGAALETIEKLMNLADVQDPATTAYLRSAQSRLDEASQLFREAGLDHMAKQITEQRITALARTARAAIFSGNMAESKRLADTIVEIDDQYPEGHAILAQWYSHHGDYPEAIACSDTAIRVSQPRELHHAYHLRGKINLAYDLPQLALQDFDLSLEHAGNISASLHEDRASALIQIGRTEQAVASYRASLEIEDQHHVRHQLGLAYRKLYLETRNLTDNSKAAQLLFNAGRQMSHALAADPSNRDYRAAYAEIANLGRTGQHDAETWDLYL